ncbi:PP2C family protein-serine/threonine phosphatase [Maridesulfovibrio sp. FT414]|uniref:PP2C family protein-serine/threonine phosphatase n=1 Tax=Maridesulfovibrio sp. FT414 TaxID=2979469 RepID=UPI003D804656
MKIEYTEFTHQGIRNENQDRLLCLTGDDNALFAIIDGMGGMCCGAEAAQEVRNSLKMSYTDIQDSASRLDGLKNALHRANNRLTESERSTRGATCSALWLEKGRYYIAHTGDTRIYRINRDKTALLTEDQNLAFTMYSIGRKTYREYLTGSGHNKLLSFVGMGKGIKLLGFEGETSPGDIFLLNSDGLNQFLQLKEVEELGHETMLQDEPYRFVVERISKVVIPNQSDDNVSWICLQVY